MIVADTYKIETQRPATRASLGGGFTNVIEVVFTTKPSGIEGKVDVPVSAFSPDEVDAIVRGQAKIIEAVQAL